MKEIKIKKNSLSKKEVAAKNTANAAALRKRRRLPYIVIDKESAADAQPLIALERFARQKLDSDLFDGLVKASSSGLAFLRVRDYLAEAFTCDKGEVLIFEKTEYGYRLWFDYNQNFISAIKAVKGYRYMPNVKLWEVEDSPVMIDVLSRHIKLNFNVVFDAVNAGILLNEVDAEVGRIAPRFDVFKLDCRAWPLPVAIGFDLDLMIAQLQERLRYEYSDDQFIVDRSSVSIYDGRSFLQLPMVTGLIKAEMNILLFEVAMRYGPAVYALFASNRESVMPMIVLYEDDVVGVATLVKPYIDSCAILGMPTFGVWSKELDGQ